MYLISNRVNERECVTVVSWGVLVSDFRTLECSRNSGFKLLCKHPVDCLEHYPCMFSVGVCCSNQYEVLAINNRGVVYDNNRCV